VQITVLGETAQTQNQEGGRKMKEQCRTCGEWFDEDDMIQTDYRTYAQQGDLDEMVCEGCYDASYGWGMQS
jgi:formylmethanofuran dehydrogenase subunit E